MEGRFAFVLLLCFVACSCQAERITVSLYYESLCPDCRHFVNEQLYPAYKKLGQYLSLHLVPYGNAERERVNGAWKFHCQHGEEECYGNKVQACALATNAQGYQKMDFINCVMITNPVSDPAIQKCAARSSLQSETILKCATGPEGIKLLEQNGEETDNLNPKHTFVPWVLFNGVYNETLVNEALDDLFNVLCDIFQDKPKECDTQIDENGDIVALQI